ncbi:MAG: hypothetical protein WC011_00895 [Candidatus Paceibacterota bacterium]
MDKQNCVALYEEYKEKKQRINTVLRMRDVSKYGEEKLNPLLLSLEDFKRLEEIAEFLVKNCKDILELSPSEWFDLQRTMEISQYKS